MIFILFFRFRQSPKQGEKKEVWHLLIGLISLVLLQKRMFIDYQDCNIAGYLSE